MTIKDVITIDFSSGFNGDDTLITAMGIGNDYVQGMTLQPDGKILVSGYNNNISNDDFILTRYNSNGSLNTTFSNSVTPTDLAISLPYFIKTLDSGYHWGNIGQAQTLTYSFATKPTGGEVGFERYSTKQQTAVRTALSKYSDVSGLTFTETTDSTDVQIRFFRDDLSSGGNSGASGYSSYPSDADVHITTTIPDLSFSGFTLLLHEIGHALGLKHPFEDPALNVLEDNQDNTIMSYNGDFGSFDIKMFDKATIHYLYGVNSTARAGDDTYHIADRYIWDGAGIDTLSASEQTQDVNLNLKAGSWIYAGTKNASILADNQAFIGFGTTLENATGGGGNDTIIGNSVKNVLIGYGGNDTLVGNDNKDLLLGGIGNDRLDGGSGNDVLDGGSGKNVLIGGSGKDIFNILVKSGIDKITDFKSIDDTIQLENSTFSKLGKSGALNPDMFKVGVASSDSNDYLIYNKISGTLLYDADANSSDAAVQIALIGNHEALTAADFIVI